MNMHHKQRSILGSSATQLTGQQLLNCGASMAIKLPAAVYQAESCWTLKSNPAPLGTASYDTKSVPPAQYSPNKKKEGSTKEELPVFSSFASNLDS